MGQLLDSWMQSELPKLQQMLLSQGAIQQPEGATTFPMPAPASAPTMQYEPPPPSMARGNEPTFAAPTMDFQQGRDRMGGQSLPQPQPTFGGQGQPMSNASPGSTFAASPPSLRPTFEPEATEEDVDISKIQSFDDLAQASPSTIDKGVDVLEQQLGGPEGMAQAYQQATGRLPDPRMSRREIGMLLMEFGLRTLAHNDGSGTGLSAIGRAGAETLGSYKQRREELRTQGVTDERAQLQNQLLRAQIEKAKTDPAELITDDEGYLVRVNKATGKGERVTDANGKPIKGGTRDAQQFASDRARAAYEGIFCVGLTGDALRECRGRALAYSKEGAATIAFPELRRERVADEVMKFIRNPDNSSVLVPMFRFDDGSPKRIRNLSEDERLQLADLWIDEQVKVGTSPSNRGRRASGSGGGSETFGLTPEQAQRIGEGKRAQLRDGTWIARRGGQLVRIDEEGNPVQ